MPKLILSSVGTSLLTQQASKEESDQLRPQANKTKAETSPEVMAMIETLKNRARQKLTSSDAAIIRRASAELNGIYGIYDNRLPQRIRDMHFLLATDTAQGQATAEIVRDFLATQGLTADVYTPEHLSAASTEQFSDGIKAVLKWCDETLTGYKQQGYEIIFNLTGGFKSLQGYLNTIGMFYADRIVYIFETGDRLIEIPRLPVELPTKIFETHAEKFLLLTAGHALPVSQFAGIPESLYDAADGQVMMLSVWGELLWNKTKAEILSKTLIELPRLSYKPSFKEEFSYTTTVTDKIKLQETLATVSHLLQQENGNLRRLKADGGLRYETYTNKTAAGYDIGHFRIGQGPRGQLCSGRRRLNPAALWPA